MTNTQLIAQHIPIEYGKVKEWAVEVINNDKSVFTIETATIPPAYRKETNICFMPNFGE